VDARPFLQIMVCSVALSLRLPMAARAEPELNLARAFSDTKAALLRGKGADILFIGDSLSFSESLEPGNQGSYLNYFRIEAQAAYGDGGAGYRGCRVWTGAAFNAGWTRGGINDDPPPHHSLDGLWAESSAEPFPPTFTDGFMRATSSSIRMHFITRPGGGSFALRLGAANGPVVATVHTDAKAEGVGTYAYHFTAQTRDLWFQPLGDGLVTLLGQENIDDERGVRVHRVANGGWGVGNYLRRDGTFDAQLQIIEPDLVFVWLGQNDLGYPLDEYRPLMESLVERIQNAVPEAELVLVGTYDSGNPALPAFVALLEDIAQQRDLGFVSVFELAGSYDFMVQNEYLIDGLHFNQAGGSYVGRLLFEVFQESRAAPPNTHSWRLPWWRRNLCDLAGWWRPGSGD
jgi:lysophospholipase L1-like esterase